MKVFFPRALPELWPLMAEYPAGAVLAGGTDFLVKMRKNGDRPPALFALERLAELRQIAVQGGELHIGAAVTISELMAGDIVRKALPALWQAAAVLGSPPVRHSATLGGNVCTASPAGDTLVPLYVFDAEVTVASAAGRRRLPIGGFIAGPGRTALAPGEIVTGVVVPLPPAGAFSAYYKVGKRQAMAIAVASLAVCLEQAGDGSVEKIRLAWGSVGPTVTSLPAVEAFLRGRRLSPAVLRQAGDMAAAAVRPIDDVRAGADYRRQLAGNLLLKIAAVGDREQEDGR
ncbi:MAG: xanthine dehydrogenase family protein subunit M [Sporomusaceae bacterium]|nr:xanthine dehydrogenase family protein subunit M [Sporomusaceae bacterium]